MEKERTYTIEITETLQRQVEIKANSPQEALEKAKEKYREEEIVLGGEDFVENDFQVLAK